MSDEILAILADQSKAIGRIEGALTQLVGNGQPGLIKEMRDDIESLQLSRSHARGYIAGVTGVLTIAEIGWHYLLHKLGGK